MAQKANGFRTNYPPDRGLVPNGALLNKFGGALNALQPGYATGHAPYSGLGNLPGTEAGFLVGIATITDDADTCPTNSLGEIDAPCAFRDKYSAVFRYLDGSFGTWRDRPTTLRIDAGPYNNSDTEMGTTPRYVIGDSVPAYFDPQSQWCIPIQSPPDYPPVWEFRGQSNTGVTRADKAIAITPNAVEISLELYSPTTSFTNFGWAPFSPRLILKPDGKDGCESGSITVFTTLRHYELLRMRCGTGPYSRADMAVARHGMSVRFLAPTPKFGGGIPEIYGPTNGFVTLPDLRWVGGSETRFKDGPIAESFDSYLRMKMQHAGDEWAAEITIWAEVRQSTMTDFVKVVTDPANAGSSDPDLSGVGSLVKGNAYGLIPGVMTTDYFGSVPPGVNMNVWLAFAEYWNNETRFEGDESVTVAEVGKVYGPCSYAGTKDVDGDVRPVYAISRLDEEYVGISNSDVEKGKVGTFYLFDGKRRRTSITVAAIAEFNAVTKDRKCIVSRINGCMTANMIECDGSSGSSQ